MRIKQILLIGEAPSRKHVNGQRAFEGRSGGIARLSDVARIDENHLWEIIETMNLRDSAQPRRGKASSFISTAETKQEALKKLFHKLDERKSIWLVLFAGWRVAEEFDWKTRNFGDRENRDKYLLVKRLHVDYGCGDCWILSAVVPHPSGVNRWWNSEENQKKFKEFMNMIMEAC